MNRIVAIYLLIGVALPYALQRYALNPLLNVLREQDQFIERLNNH